MKNIFFLGLFVGAMASCSQTTPNSSSNNPDLRARGKYLSVISGCNDCHTPRWPETGGQVKEEDWLTGTSLGYHGGWGTTYPTNLRLFFNQVTEDQWVSFAKVVKIKPPMPYWILNTMTESDLRAMYQFVRSLGPKGEPVPADLPPGQKPKTPYLIFSPVTP